MIFSLQSSGSTILINHFHFIIMECFWTLPSPLECFLGINEDVSILSFKIMLHSSVIGVASINNREQGSNCPSNGSSLVHSPSSCQSEVNIGSCRNPHSILHIGLPHRKSVPNLHQHSSFHSMWAKTILLIPI